MPSAKPKKGSAKGAKKSAKKPAAAKRPPSKGKQAATKRRASRAAPTDARGAKGRKILFLNLGRPSVINAEVIESICGYIAEGLSFENSCVYSGIADSTGRDWLRRARVAFGRMDDERRRIAEEQSTPDRKVDPADVDVEPTEQERLFIEFSAAVKRAQAHFQITNLRLIGRGVERWQGRAWLLERRFADEYAIHRGGKSEPAPAPAKGNQPIDRVVGRYTEIYVNSETVPMPTPEQIKAGIDRDADDEED